MPSISVMEPWGSSIVFVFSTGGDHSEKQETSSVKLQGLEDPSTRLSSWDVEAACRLSSHLTNQLELFKSLKDLDLSRNSLSGPILDWIKETRQGYKQSGLASQCMHRYKIYIEGSAWSVSEKYILAWKSVTLQAQDIGKAASDFIQQDLKMDHVYEYMFHLLSDYA
ncbi:hypothetical protein Vadar_015909 [Vaccinium darrowii]|uniref:Uncharacterized protein n=1 Tax=Vaccinium darrowii TaxID=229202 RepID=A0ACB7YP42_9ERIC|nr:hypothetical protein Vadar_015909 [Vaccinium darrowii]